jgi:hypothetical protein
MDHNWMQYAQKILIPEIPLTQWLFTSNCLPPIGSKIDCTKCGYKMTLTTYRNTVVYRSGRCKSSKTFISHIFNLSKHITDEHFYLLLSCWAADYTVEQAASWSTISKPCASFYYAQFRHRCKVKLMNEISENPNKDIVEIDESQMGKRKYNVGRISTTDWFFGVCDPEPGGRVYIIKVDQRDKKTLVPIIHSLIEPGTIIMSDG